MGHRVKFVFVICAALLLVQGCKPKDIIPRQDMEEIFSEFYVADAVIETINSNRGEFKTNPDSMMVYQPIIEKHGYSKEMFISSLNYYIRNSDDLAKIFHNVHVNLSRQAEKNASQEVIDRADEDETDIEEAILPEGAEPAIEKGELPDAPRKGKSAVKGEERPRKDSIRKESPRKESKSKKKKMTKEDLKRLEEELK